MRKKIMLFVVLVLPISCADPLREFYGQLKHYGYIPYTTPMSYAGTGTLIGGSPKGMEIVANPDTCFPNVNGGETPVRFRDETVLPTTRVHFFLNTNLQASVLKALATGAPSIKLGVDISHAETVELSFDGVHVEYLDSIRLVDYYRNHMSQLCKDYLDKVGFVIQAIVADKMRFSLYKSDGGRIQLSVDNINQYFNLSIDTQWQIDTTATLIITTPKYVGYQLGELRQKNQGIGLRRARKLILNTWAWEDIGIFNEYEE